LQNLKAFFKDWRNFALIAALVAVAGWIFSRVSMVNPAILGDEYLYSINARHAAPWDPSPAGDFSNFLTWSMVRPIFAATPSIAAAKF